MEPPKEKCEASTRFSKGLIAAGTGSLMTEAQGTAPACRSCCLLSSPSPPAKRAIIAGRARCTNLLPFAAGAAAGAAAAAATAAAAAARAAARGRVPTALQRGLQPQPQPQRQPAWDDQEHPAQ